MGVRTIQVYIPNANLLHVYKCIYTYIYIYELKMIVMDIKTTDKVVTYLFYSQYM